MPWQQTGPWFESFQWILKKASKQESSPLGLFWLTDIFQFLKQTSTKDNVLTRIWFVIFHFPQSDSFWSTTGFVLIEISGGKGKESLSKALWIENHVRDRKPDPAETDKNKLNSPLAYSRSLCQSAICRRGELHTSFQWLSAEPLLRGPPSSSRPMTSFFVTLSQSRSISSRETPSSVCPVPSVVGISNAKLSLKTGLKVRFFTCVFFFAIRCP